MRIKHAIYNQQARLGKSLASGPRLAILDLLTQGPRSVESLADNTGQSVANTSRHLQVLARARLVTADRDGVTKYYRLATPAVSAFVVAFRQLAEDRLPEIEDLVRMLRPADATLKAVERDALLAQVRGGEVTVLDVRPADEYASAHLPGAQSIPVSELEARLGEIPRDRAVVAYCRGPYCVMAKDAVALLRSRGFDAAHLDEGVAEWRARGLVATSDVARSPS